MEGHKFLNAYFVNEERTVVESLWNEESTNLVREQIIVAEEGNAAWENLLKHIDIDTLHEMTFKRIRDLDEAYKDQVIAIAKERGMVYDIDSINTDIYKAIAKSLFTPFDANEDKEKLFMFKLQLFEEEHVKNSTNKALKTKLRKSKSILEATKAAIEILESN